MSTAFCKACGKPIIWIRTTAGRMMPVDQKPVEYIPIQGGSRTFVTEEGSVVKGELPEVEGEPTATGYIPHWSTCTNPRRFRRKK